MKTDWDYRSCTEYIEGIVRFTKEKSAGSLKRILRHFGDPQDRFAYIHVAGTNGKGSVCAYIDSMLRKGGVHTGLFTSPHLIETTERMKVDGKDIPREEFTRIFCQLYDFVDQAVKDERSGIIHPTYFEWLYIMAVIWFAEKKVSYGIMETGLGGRLDATNVIDHRAICVITSISYDHMAILGNTLSQIAFEKAGIIKEGVPLICDGSEREALEVTAARAEDLHSPFTVVFPAECAEETDTCYPGSTRTAVVKKILNKGKNIDFYLKEMYHDRDNIGEEAVHIELNTGAGYQAVNSSLAFLAVRELMRRRKDLQGLDREKLLEGLRDAHWPGRLDQAADGLIVDGAHNVGGARQLCASLNSIYQGKKDITLVFAVASDKDHGGMARELSKICGLKSLIITQIEGSRRTSIETVAHDFAGYLPQEVRVQALYPASRALDAGRRQAGPDGLLVCAGSLYLAGSILKDLRDQAEDPHR